jgi:hypothetical protein
MPGEAPERSAGVPGAAPAPVGLSLSKQVFEQRTGRTLVLVNRETGEMVEVDSQAMRVRRMRKRIVRWAQSVEPYWTDPAYIPCLATLTYRPGVEWRPYHVSEFTRWLRKQLGDLLVGYAVVAELQERGAVHFHVIWVQKRGKRVPKPDQSGGWPYGMTRVEASRTPFYLAKYAQKGDSEKEFPKGLRLFTVVLRKAAVTAIAFAFLRLSVLPYYVEEQCRGKVITGAITFPSRCPGGGFDVGGERIRSPWLLKEVR